MPEKVNGSNKNSDQRKTILGRLFSKPHHDAEYMSDLKSQWAELNPSGRVKFVLGALIGLCLFLGTMFLAYLALSALIR